LLRKQQKTLGGYFFCRTLYIQLESLMVTPLILPPLLLLLLLRATAATAVARLSHRNSVRLCPSVCHTGGSVKNGAS